MTLPIVVEDPADRDRFARAFRSTAGPAEVSIVRVTASEEARFERLRAREPEGYWRDFARDRTVELHDILEEADLDDAAVVNEDRDRLDTAREVLERIGW